MSPKVRLIASLSLNTGLSRLEGKERSLFSFFFPMSKTSGCHRQRRVTFYSFFNYKMIIGLSRLSQAEKNHFLLSFLNYKNINNAEHGSKAPGCHRPKKSLFVLFILIQGRGYPRIENDFLGTTGFLFLSWKGWYWSAANHNEWLWTCHNFTLVAIKLYTDYNLTRDFQSFYWLQSNEWFSTCYNQILWSSRAAVSFPGARSQSDLVWTK